MKRAPRHLKAGYDGPYRAAVGVELIVPAARAMSCDVCGAPLTPRTDDAQSSWMCDKAFHGKIITHDGMLERLLATGGCHKAYEAWDILKQCREGLQRKAAKK